MDAFIDMTVLSLKQATGLPYLTRHLAHGWDEGHRARDPAFGHPNRMIGENCLGEDKTSVYFIAINVGKKGLTLNLGSHEVRPARSGDEGKRGNRGGVKGGEEWAHDRGRRSR